MEGLLLLKKIKWPLYFIIWTIKKFYEVGAITEPLSKIAPGYPVVIETAIFNFNDKIICDGMINQNVLLGKNIAEGFLTEYNDSIKKGEVLKKL